MQRPFGCILAFESNVAIATLLRELRLSRGRALVCVLGVKGGVYAAGDEIGTAEMCDDRTPDAERLLIFSALRRDNIQEARGIRGTPGLAGYSSDSIGIAQPPM